MTVKVCALVAVWGPGGPAGLHVPGMQCLSLQGHITVCMDHVSSVGAGLHLFLWIHGAASPSLSMEAQGSVSVSMDAQLSTSLSPWMPGAPSLPLDARGSSSALRAPLRAVGLSPLPRSPAQSPTPLCPLGILVLPPHPGPSGGGRAGGEEEEKKKAVAGGGPGEAPGLAAERCKRGRRRRSRPGARGAGAPGAGAMRGAAAAALLLAAAAALSGAAESAAVRSCAVQSVGCKCAAERHKASGPAVPRRRVLCNGAALPAPPEPRLLPDGTATL